MRSGRRQPRLQSVQVQQGGQGRLARAGPGRGERAHGFVAEPAERAGRRLGHVRGLVQVPDPKNAELGESKKFQFRYRIKTTFQFNSTLSSQIDREKELQYSTIPGGTRTLPRARWSLGPRDPQRCHHRHRLEEEGGRLHHLLDHQARRRRPHSHRPGGGRHQQEGKDHPGSEREGTDRKCQPGAGAPEGKTIRSSTN